MPANRSFDFLISTLFLDGGDTEYEAAKDQKKGFTKGRNLAANALHKICPRVQSAARLSHQKQLPNVCYLGLTPKHPEALVYSSCRAG